MISIAGIAQTLMVQGPSENDPSFLVTLLGAGIDCCFILPVTSAKGFLDGKDTAICFTAEGWYEEEEGVSQEVAGVSFQQEAGWITIATKEGAAREVRRIWLQPELVAGLLEGFSITALESLSASQPPQPAA